jgi:hypothetical protein
MEGHAGLFSGNSCLEHRNASGLASAQQLRSCGAAPVGTETQGITALLNLGPDRVTNVSDFLTQIACLTT